MCKNEMQLQGKRKTLIAYGNELIAITQHGDRIGRTPMRQVSEMLWIIKEPERNDLERNSELYGPNSRPVVEPRQAPQRLEQQRYKPIQWGDEDRKKYTLEQLRATDVVNEELWYGIDFPSL